MFTRYKWSIHRLTEMLRHLEAHPDDLDCLLKLQWRLVDLIRRTERRIGALRELRRTLKQRHRASRQPKAGARATKERINAIGEHISANQHLLFVWRCFGDGIAFLYLDKYALKQTLYNTHDYYAKQTAGTLSGKAGLRLEWAIVRKFCKNLLPAMLCDITNTIRHGDVCPLIGQDPFPIEVKASKNSNARVARQLESLKSLHEFLINDEAVDFRGSSTVRRVEFVAPEVNFVDEVNQCIAEAQRIGLAQTSPEDGLFYVCVGPDSTSDQFNAVLRSDCFYTLLNEAKSAGTWMPYYPFTLSIRNATALYQFIAGDLTLIVMVHVPTMLSLFASKGLKAELVDHEDWFMVVSREGAKWGENPFITVSTPFFGRLFHEFQSLEWFVQCNLDHLEVVEAEYRGVQGKMATGEVAANELTTGFMSKFKPLNWPGKGA